MSNPAPSVDLSPCGLAGATTVHYQCSVPALVEAAIARHEAQLSDVGAVVARTGQFTGRAPKNRLIVRDDLTESTVNWGQFNLPLETGTFDRVRDKVRGYLQKRELFVTDGEACADHALRLPLRVVAEKAWHALFARHLFRRPSVVAEAFRPQWHILAAPDLMLDPQRDGVPGTAIIALSFTQKTVVIAGTHYAGEIKKAVFSILNFLLPMQGVLSMHCSANIGHHGDTALFFGLSGTGKTTLSADPERRLIGDDEHGWSGEGVFNIEGGCYAKTIKLSRESEPQIWDAIRFGSVLENVVMDERTRVPDFDDARWTENTRAAYPLDAVALTEPSGRGGHPQNIFFLTCDAFAVLPPLAKLTPEQAMYHFLCGYTAKVAGTEAGVKEPDPTFSTCFGAPFMPLPPVRYAEMLRERLNRHRCPVWLVNTGWTAGPYGVGHRMKLSHTRTLLQAALGGRLADATLIPDPVFGVLVPTACPGVPNDILTPRKTWADRSAFDGQARKLATLFREKFETFAGQVDEGVRQAGPRG